MTDNEFMKVLECCAKSDGAGCNECPLNREECWNSDIDGLALDLINRQKAEIEKLQDILIKLRENHDKAKGIIIEQQRMIAERDGTISAQLHNIDSYVKALKEKMEEIERLKGRLKAVETSKQKLLACFKSAGDIAIKKFVFALKTHAYYIDFPIEHKVVDEDDIDNLVREMVGDE